MAIVSYADAKKIFDRVMIEENGVFLPAASNDEIVSNRHRLYSFRNADRKNSKDLYEPSDPAYGTSEYDRVIIKTTILNGQLGLMLKNTEFDDIQLFDPLTGKELD